MTKFPSRNDAYASVVDLLWIWAKDCIAERQQSQEEMNNEVRERRNQRLGQGQSNIHTLNGPGVSIGAVHAGGNVIQRSQAAGRDINN
jgi:hypothetical protein